MEQYRTECDAFITKNYNKLYKYALHKTKGDADLAGDVVQDVCLRLMEGKGDVNFQVGTLSLIQTMMTTYLSNAARHKKVEAKYEDEAAYGASLGYLEQSGLERQGQSYLGLRHDIPKLLKALTPRERQFILWDMEGFTVPEMMKMMEKPIAKQRTYEIIKEAREKMKQRALVLLAYAEADDRG